MAKISNYKRITYEDYSEESAEMMEDLSDILNPFMREVTDAINGNLDFENLDQNTIEFQVSVDSSGKPNNNKLNVQKSSVKGMTVISARNLSNSSVYANGQPFISFSPTTTQNVITINNISNLPANNTFLLTIIVY